MYWYNEMVVNEHLITAQNDLNMGQHLQNHNKFIYTEL